MSATKQRPGKGGHTNGTNGKVNGAYTNGHSKMEDKATAQDSTLAYIFNKILSPLFLITSCPNGVMMIWYTERHCGGSYLEMVNRLFAKGIITGLSDMWGSVTLGSALSVYVLLGYSLFAITLQMLLPGPRGEGPVTPKGNTPVYKDNGFKCYIVTMIALATLQYIKPLGLSTTMVYDHFDQFLGTITIFSLIFCAMLYLKGIYAPSTSDCGSSGNPIFDYYWGTELYPKIFGVDIKVFTNCRFGMTIWPILVTVFALKSYEVHGFVDSMWVSWALQMAYFTKFFWWELGYMRTIDIMVDRAGFYICWGCMCWVPGLYASVSLYLVQQPIVLGPVVSMLFLALGLFSIAINYLADWQKQAVRDSNGDCLIWGKKPEMIHAKYNLENGDERESILLVSGWWGVGRHFHYVPELVLAFMWTVPALFHNLMPYSYFIFLVILLVHRTFRDDDKCSRKYGVYWEEYCKKVPYKMIPGIF